MLIVRKRNKKEAHEQEKGRRAARKRAALIRLVCVSALVAGLLGFFVYKNIDYFSPYWESAAALIDKKKPAQAKHQTPPPPPREHKSAKELLGVPEFFDEGDVMPLNNLLVELSAEMAAEEERESGLMPPIQQALLTQTPPPEPAAEPAKPDTAPHPLVSMAPAQTEKPEPDKKAQDVAPEPPAPQPAPEQGLAAAETEPSGAAHAPQTPSPEWWEPIMALTPLKPKPEQDSAKTWWEPILALNPLKPKPEQDSAKTWWEPILALNPLKPKPEQDSAKAWWETILALNPLKPKPKQDGAETWVESLKGSAKMWLESALALNPLKPKPEHGEAEAEHEPPAEAEQAPAARKQEHGETGAELASQAPADSVKTGWMPLASFKSLVSMIPLKPAPKEDPAGITPVSLSAEHHHDSAGIEQAAAKPAPRQDSAAVKQAAPPPKQEKQEPAAKQAAQTPAPKPDTAAKTNPEAGSMMISNIRCRLADRDDISINVSVELFYDSRALQDETNSKRGALAAVLNSVVLRQEYGNVAMAALSGELLDAFNDVLKTGQLSSVDIISFNVVQ